MVGIKARETVPGKVGPLCLGHGVFIVLSDVMGHRDQEASSTTDWVADGIVVGWLQQFPPRASVVFGSAKLAIGPGGADLTGHILVQVPCMSRSVMSFP